MQLCIFLSLKVMGTSHCCRDTGGKVESHTGLPQVSSLGDSFLSSQSLLPCACVLCPYWVPQYRDITEKLQQVLSRLVWAGVEGLRHLVGMEKGWLWQEDPSVTSNIYKEVFKKIVPGSSQCCLVWRWKTPSWKGRGSRFRVWPGYEWGLLPHEDI